MKHFISGSTIDLSKMDRERKLAEILVEEAPADRNAQELAAEVIVHLEVEEEEEGGNFYLPRFILSYIIFFNGYVSVVQLLILMKKSLLKTCIDFTSFLALSKNYCLLHFLSLFLLSNK